MTTDFQIISGETVPKDYCWDLGNPLETTPTFAIADSTTEYISGYAPGLKVLFKPNITDLIYAGFTNVSATYIWNFGDYYNSASNIAVLPCQEIIEHTFILPGKYNITLTNIQSKDNQPPGDEDDKCFGKHKIGWYWDNLEKTDLRKTTWDETMCFPPATAVNKRPKWWSEEDKCLQKFCKVWNWKDLSPTGKNPIFWYQTYKYGDYYKRWDYEANLTICTIDEAKATIDTTEQTAIKTYMVEVKEIMPVAAIYNDTLPLTGYSPFTFKLSPTRVKTGSFPIDRIEWNAGDGTSTKVVTRYSTPDSNYFVYNNAYFSDPQDPRNYDFVYTITRNSNMYPVFYPSLTCYSASTNSSDSCSIVVGPILLKPQTNDIQLLKAKNTVKGDFYGIEIDSNIAFLTSLTSTETKSSTTIVQTQPTSPIKQTANTDPIVFFGNTGQGYPPPFTPSCTYNPSEPTLLFLITEENELSGIFLEDTTLLYK